MAKKSKRRIASWFKELGNALIKPDNIATSIVLVIFLSILIYFAKPLLINEVDAFVYPAFKQTKLIENTTKTNIYFTFVNTGNVPLELKDVHYAWSIYDTKTNSKKFDWVNQRKLFYDIDGNELTQTIIPPYEKLKLYTEISKPNEIDSKYELHIIYVCIDFTPTEFVLRDILFGGLRGICNPTLQLLWIEY